ncbi:MAG TPA: GTPase Era [Chitinophagaceae bacterium]
MKSGFVNIFGKPNAGKSTLLNALLDQKLAIVSSKVQTTRHRIKGFLTEPSKFQIIFSDTPGIIHPKYRLQERMMQAVKNALEDADVALLLVDSNDDIEDNHQIFDALKLKVPSIVVLNKIDKTPQEKLSQALLFFSEKPYCNKTVTISALKKLRINELIETILYFLPEGEPFYNEDDLTDLPTKFFVSELIREKIYQLFEDEVPYHTAVLINEFKEKNTLTKIQADIIVQRESQKAILLGENGRMIKKLGTLAREDIEKFLQQKIFLQLFVKVRPKWRDSEMHLREYGY